MMLIVGLPSLSFILLVGLIKYRLTKSAYYLIILRRIIIYSCLAIPLQFVSDVDITALYYRDYPAYIEAVRKAEANPGNQELQSNVIEESNKIGN